MAIASVSVDELLNIERYSHVMHLVSNVKGILKSDCNTVDLTTIWGQVGAGIVADSDPQKESDESLHKAQAQLLAIGRRVGNGASGGIIQNPKSKIE